MKINGLAGSKIEVREQCSTNSGWVLEIDVMDSASGMRTIYLNEAQAKVFSLEYNTRLTLIQELNSRLVSNKVANGF